jgi:hypothetical protein
MSEEKKVYEVFRTKGFTAVVVPGSRTSRKLWEQRYFTGDVKLTQPKEWYSMQRVGLVEQVKNERD